MELLRDPELGAADDALRLFLMHYVSAEEVSETELEQCVQALSERGADLTAVQFAKRWRSAAGEGGVGGKGCSGGDVCGALAALWCTRGWVCGGGGGVS